jgi:hypothetical protein
MALTIRPLDASFAAFAIVATFAQFLQKRAHRREKRGHSAARIAIIDFAVFSQLPQKVATITSQQFSHLRGKPSHGECDGS